jgi:outer membrane lipoprotein-sorting protein
MSADERFIELCSDYLEGELDETGVAELRRLLAEDDRLVQMAADSHRTHRLLGLIAQDSESQRDDLVQQTLNRLPVEDNDRVGAVMRRVSPGTAATARPRPRSLDNWRRIMRSPICRASVGAVLVLAIAGVAWRLQVSGTQYAFADFVKPILEAESAKFKAAFERNGKQVATADVMVSGSRARMELQEPGQPMVIHIVDYGRSLSACIDKANKIAVIQKLVGLPRERASMNLLEEMRLLILDADKPDVKRESLGEKEIDGRRAVGWRLSGPGLHEPGVTVTIWGDPATGLPIRMESYYAMDGQKGTLSDPTWDPDLDESLFSLDPPDGYQVIKSQVDLSPVAEHLFNQLVSAEPNITTLLAHYPASLQRDSAALKTLTLREYGSTNDITVTGVTYVDATYEGISLRWPTCLIGSDARGATSMTSRMRARSSPTSARKPAHRMRKTAS